MSLEFSVDKLNRTIENLKVNEVETIQDLYKTYNIPISTLSNAYEIPTDSIRQIINE